MSLTTRKVLTASEREAAMQRASRKVDEEIREAGGIDAWRAQQLAKPRTTPISNIRPNIFETDHTLSASLENPIS